MSKSLSQEFDQMQVVDILQFRVLEDTEIKPLGDQKIEGQNNVWEQQKLSNLAIKGFIYFGRRCVLHNVMSPYYKQ
jgi:hypothetical protein